MSIYLQQCSVGNTARDQNNFAGDMSILLVELSVCCFCMQFQNITMATGLRSTLEERLGQTTNHDHCCIIIITKSSTSQEKEINKTKRTFGGRLFKETALSFLTSLTPQIPIPSECPHLPLRNPREPIFQWPLIRLLGDNPPLTFFSLGLSYFLSLKLVLRFSVLIMNFQIRFSPLRGAETFKKYSRRVLNSWVVTH